MDKWTVKIDVDVVADDIQGAVRQVEDMAENDDRVIAYAIVAAEFNEDDDAA